VTDHYLLDPEGVLIPDSLGPANNKKNKKSERASEQAREGGP